ncbi:hypothetical protein EVAR_83220_1 [Eumeta japonica]|uniref:Uncharacterized protein n=1 Tax=Eumeta variegata TaxID=151549 RepID=A0A4C1Y501_EUMVA|nr:hypothetical protein EVAR_83220_1 [Eumeta japonica]
MPLSLAGLLPPIHSTEDSIPALHEESAVLDPQDQPKPLSILPAQEMHRRRHEQRCGRRAADAVALCKRAGECTLSGPQVNGRRAPSLRHAPRRAHRTAPPHRTAPRRTAPHRAARHSATVKAEKGTGNETAHGAGPAALLERGQGPAQSLLTARGARPLPALRGERPPPHVKFKGGAARAAAQCEGVRPVYRSSALSE